jgi:hypothetical protein
VRLNGEKAGYMTLALNLTFTDTGEQILVAVENAVLNHWPDRRDPAGAEVSLSRATLIQLVLGETEPAKAEADGQLQGGSHLVPLLSALDRFDFWFEIVSP